MKKSTQSGIAHIGLLLIAAVGLISYLVISSSASFKNQLFASLYPKNFSFAQGVGTTDPNGFTSPEPTGIGSTAPDSSSSPTPTSTPTSYTGPTPAPDPWGGKTIHAVDGTNCFDSDENFPVNEDFLVQGYCVDKTGVYYDYCKSVSDYVIDFFCNSYDPPYDQYTTYCREGGGGASGMRSCANGAYTVTDTSLVPMPSPLDRTAPTPTPIPMSLAPDIKPPTVSVISPQSNTNVSGTVPVEVSASDDSGIRKVEFYIGGNGKEELVATITKPPYKYMWDTTQYKNNIYYFLDVYVYDGWNNSIRTGALVTVQNPTPTPSPTPTPTPTPTPAAPYVFAPGCFPQTGYTDSGVTISWNDLGVNWVDIDTDSTFSEPYYHKNVTGLISTAAPIGFNNFCSSGSCNGSLTLYPNTTYYARVYNGINSSGTSFSRPACATPTPSPTPGPDKTAPVVKVTYPANGSTFPAKTKITGQATATDNVGVTKVEFYIAQKLTCTDTIAPYTCSFSMPAYSFTFQARAYDKAGNISWDTINVYKSR